MTKSITDMDSEGHSMHELLTLPTGAWDLIEFFKNGKNWVGVAGGGLLALLGTIAFVWGAVLLLKKLMAGQQNQDSWIKIILLIIIGGAIGATGFTLISTIASGGKKTIEDLGTGGFVILPQILGLIS